MTTLSVGGCLCGAVRFEAAGPLRDLCICHCTSCRRAVGAPFVPWGTCDSSAFRLTLGALREVSSSASVMRGFCGACGTSITYRRTDKPSELDITLATLDDANAWRPACHLWVEDKLSWVDIRDGLPQYARSRSGDAATT